MHDTPLFLPARLMGQRSTSSTQKKRGRGHFVYTSQRSAAADDRYANQAGRQLWKAFNPPFKFQVFELDLCVFFFWICAEFGSTFCPNFPAVQSVKAPTYRCTSLDAGYGSEQRETAYALQMKRNGALYGMFHTENRRFFFGGCHNCHESYVHTCLSLDFTVHVQCNWSREKQQHQKTNTTTTLK